MMKQVSLPLHQYPLHCTTSIDEARHLYNNAEAPADLEKADGQEPFECQVNFVAVGPLNIWAFWLRPGFRVRFKAQADTYLLTVPKAGRGQYRVGDQTCPLAPGHAALTSPSTYPTAWAEPGYMGAHVVIPPAAVETAFASLVGPTWKTPLRFEPAIQATTTAASSVRLFDFLLEELDRDETALRAPIFAERLIEAFLLGLLSHQAHSHSHLLHARTHSAEHGYIRRIEEYLEARADSPVTLADLAALTSRSVRSIQAGFLAVRGYTPMEFLRARRLELAHRRLLSGAFTSVTAAAIDSGFAHLGRFSVEYRARFGESPRETLRRGLGADPQAPDVVLADHRTGNGARPR